MVFIPRYYGGEIRDIITLSQPAYRRSISEPSESILDMMWNLFYLKMGLLFCSIISLSLLALCLF